MKKEPLAGLFSLNNFPLELGVVGRERERGTRLACWSSFPVSLWASPTSYISMGTCRNLYYWMYLRAGCAKQPVASIIWLAPSWLQFLLVCLSLPAYAILLPSMLQTVKVSSWCCLATHSHQLFPCCLLGGWASQQHAASACVGKAGKPSLWLLHCFPL